MRALRKLFIVLLVGAGCSNPSVVSTDSGVAACVTVAFCKLSPDSISNCTSNVAGVNNAYFAAQAGFSGAEVNCLAGAGHDCDAARRCLNNGMTPQACSGGASCMGNNLIGCSATAGTGGNQGTTSFDCTTAGEMCVGAGGNVGCGFGTCSGGADTCVGTKVQSCNNGILKQLDCAMFGSTCATTLIAHCRGTGPACTATLGNQFGGIRCDGSRAIYCFDGQEASFDCASIQTGCFSNPKGQGGFGCALGSACDPAGFSVTCTGSKLSFCNNGKLDTYDCAAHGYKTCDLNAGCSI